VTLKLERMYQRVDTTSGWIFKNTVLKAAEIGVELDDSTGEVIGFKIGDDTTAWMDLDSYVSGAADAVDAVSNVATSRILGRITAGSGDSEELTAAQVKTLLAIANTDVSGLGTMSTQAASAVTITGGSVVGITDLAIADGGTGASTAATARTNLGLDNMAVQAKTAVDITGGTIVGITDLAVADGGTGSSTASGARTNLGLGTAAVVDTGTSAANVPTITQADARYRPIVAETTSTTTVSNTVTETSLVSLATPTGLAAGDRLQFRVGGSILNNSGSTVTYTFRFKLGGTTYATSNLFSIATGANQHGWFVEAVIAVITVASSQSVSGSMLISQTGTAGLVLTANATGYGAFNPSIAVAAEDLSTTKNAVMSVEMGTANASANCVMLQASLMRLVKV
jgi:hypothetical protein